ncbi:RNA-dependent RNA polymerase [Wenzhou Myotis laniger tupavirus 1]|uniref:RNA-dependent RNA polymerase n=1 Tax=Wenzhou Myotis laniger tupavirus 1 TaxID=2929005 RepID=UPI002481CDDC|nr:RNA-dependent RNA polymerase [Wenzhou Myotis laniger tupavirus 1]UOX72924.1 RNA-dependent RNA polymerase [Wenzhou Myotis laniger tupavirus 1]
METLQVEDWELDAESELYSDEADWIQGKKLPPLGSIKNADYNLNNPLLNDDLTSFFNFYQGRSYEQIFENHHWKFTRRVISNLQLKIRLNTETHHSWFGTYLQKTDFNVKPGRKLIELTEQQSKKTHIIPEVFLSTLGENFFPFLNRGKSITELEYLTKFLDWHCIILTLNHYQDNLSILNGIVQIEKIPYDDSHYFKLVANSLGKVIVLPWCVILENGILITKNFCLMIKDVLLARFQTLITMYPRHDKKFQQKDVDTLLKIYQIGDRMLYTLGNLSYDHLKLLEPLCNLRLCQLANEERPLIPEFPNFRLYLEEEIQKAEVINPLIRTLWDTLKKVSDPNVIIQIFGCFRHWGHPFIDYFEGLSNLHTQVTIRKNVDDSLAQALGSDLAYLVLRTQFKKQKKWFVDIEKLERNHPLYQHILNNTWPTPKAIEDFGDRWHLLPLTACFEIPDLVDPSLIYSDKSHSCYRSDLIRHVRTNTYTRFPTKRVLSTFLEKPARNWKEFLTQINDEGLPDECLCIGLRPKERELKRAGRFFALMSWELREYFVFTEYLIKEHYIPLFKGLTMADDMTGVIKKLLENSNGHGEDDYNHITISNHLDYSKWNNHQRLESNKYVFQVMGAFLGYPNLISRTHEFFQNSLIYFINRPDLMMVKDNTLINKTENLVCWNGQAGGLEGLRQKGWSILNLLLILRIGKLRNTEIKILAQGDNQVLNMHYKLPSHRDQLELLECIKEITRNNDYIMMEVDNWTQRLGLIINKDETMQSADFLIYGKIPIYRGNLTLPESKRWARVNCVTNDQLPTFANVLSTVSSTALTVSHFSSSYRDPIELYNFLGNFARILLEFFNPILNNSLLTLISPREKLNKFEYLVGSLYLDPSLGGICGMSLTRFLIRNFPDPVTEGLSFWKRVGEKTTDPNLKRLCLRFGQPKLGSYKLDDLIKLMEKPESLNIPSGLSAQILIRGEIRNILRRNVRLIKNEIISNAINYGMNAEEHLLRFLAGIKPLFPRFLAEFKASTYLGLTESLVGLYENSKTIRNKFLSEREREIDSLVQKSELHGLSYLLNLEGVSHVYPFWSCSSSLADNLRFRSWGQKVIGATVPHPYEMLSKPFLIKVSKDCCTNRGNDYVTTFGCYQKTDLLTRKGPYLPYLGSRTSESTSLITPWEKEAVIPLIKRASKLRNVVNWFVEANSNLDKSIRNNLEALTGEDAGESNKGFLRTGSALHRFSSSRQSSGGFSALSPAFLSRFLTTTDTLGDLGDKNYDFMFQSLILYCQSSLAGLDLDGFIGVVHHHIECKQCVREITEPILESQQIYRPLNVSHHIKKWIPGDGDILKQKGKIDLQVGDWTRITDQERSYHVGRAIGFVYADFVYSSTLTIEDSSLFPLSIRNNLHADFFYEGLLDGLIRGCAIHITHRRNVALLKKPRETLTGSIYFVITKLSLQTQFLTLVRLGPLNDFLLSRSHRTPPSYPLSKWDLGAVVRHYLKSLFLELSSPEYKTRFTTTWIFADLVGIEIAGPLTLSSLILPYVCSPNKHKMGVEKLRQYKQIEINMRQKEAVKLEDIPSNRVLLCSSEVRHSVKSISPNSELIAGPRYKFGREISGEVEFWKIEFLTESLNEVLPDLSVPRIMCPLISGLRTVQLATGAHYKVRSILHKFKLHFRDFLCGGDGSGGLTAMCLRENKLGKGIFNSLLDLGGYDLRGSKPSEPSAVNSLGCEKSRCVNSKDCWENPSDLTQSSTWNYFSALKKVNKLSIDLMIFDMENRDDQSSLIETQLLNHVDKLLSIGGSIIFKTYVHRIWQSIPESFLLKLGKHFKNVYLCQTAFTSSFSSELYILFHLYHPNCSNPGSIDTHGLLKFLKSRYVFKQPTDELKRACSLLDLDLEQGIPKELLPNPEVELATCLEISGIESGKAAVLSNFCINFNCSLTEKYFILKAISFSSVFQLTAISTHQPTIMSDNKLIKYFSFFIGLDFWHSWTTKNDLLFQTLNNILKNDLFVTHRYEKHVKGWSQTLLIGSLTPGKEKRLRLQAQSAGIGSAIRCLRRSCHINESPIRLFRDKLLQRFDQGLQEKFIMARTNIFDYWKNYKENKHLPVSSEIINTGRQEECSHTD